MTLQPNPGKGVASRTTDHQVEQSNPPLGMRHLKFMPQNPKLSPRPRGPTLCHTRSSHFICSMVAKSKPKTLLSSYERMKWGILWPCMAQCLSSRVRDNHWTNDMNFKWLTPDGRFNCSTWWTAVQHATTWPRQQPTGPLTHLSCDFLVNFSWLPASP